MNSAQSIFDLLASPGGGYSSYFYWLSVAWAYTLKLSVFSFALAMALGSCIGILRTWHGSRFLSSAAYVWIEVFRNIPVLVQIFLWFYVLPNFIPALGEVPPLLTAILALGFYTSPRIAEQLRSIVQSTPRGQTQAGTALGLSQLGCYRYILLPIAFRTLVPALTNEVMNIVKNSSVAFVIAVPELTYYAIQAGEESQHNGQMYIAATVLYMITSLTGNRIMKYLEARYMLRW